MLRKIHISIQRSAIDIKTAWPTSYADPEKKTDFREGGGVQVIIGYLGGISKAYFREVYYEF